MKQLVTITAVVIAIAFGSSAYAGSYYGQTYTTYVGPTDGYSYAPASYYVTPPAPRRTLVWHNTTHVDVVPGRWVAGPAGLTYIPPRRVLHVDGHYDAVPSYTLYGHGHSHAH